MEKMIDFDGYFFGDPAKGYRELDKKNKKEFKPVEEIKFEDLIIKDISDEEKERINRDTRRRAKEHNDRLSSIIRQKYIDKTRDDIKEENFNYIWKAFDCPYQDVSIYGDIVVIASSQDGRIVDGYEYFYVYGENLYKIMERWIAEQRSRNK